MISYRPFKSDDIDTLMHLMHELGYAVDTESLCERTEGIRQHEGEVIVAEQDNLVVGCVNCIIDIRLAEGRCGEIVSLIVSKKYRGAGIGKNLVQHAEAWLAKRCSIIRVRANAVRTTAHEFYTARGYNEIKSQKIFIKKL